MKNAISDNKIIFTSVFITTFFLQGYCIVNGENNNEIDSLIDKIEFYIDNHYPDTAFNMCLMARSRGLPKEQLYFLLADVYIEKNKYDSALVFNYGAGTFYKDSAILPINILQQRYSIYSSLSWNQRAENIGDTILQHPEIKHKKLLPEIKLIGGGGYRFSDIVSYDVYPWIENDSVANENGGLFNVQFSALWSLPDYKNEKFNFSIDGSFEKPYWQEHIGIIDSLHRYFGVNLGFKNIPKPFSAGIGSGLKRYDKSTLYWKNKINISCVKNNLFQLWYLNIYYNMDLNSDFDIENQSVGLISSNNLFLKKRWGLNLLLSMSGYFAEVTENTILLDVLYVSMETDDVIYYSDSTFSEEIESTNLTGIQHLKQIYESVGTVKVYNNIPQNQYTISGDIEFNYDINKVVQAGITMGGGFVKYIDKYSWVKTDPMAFSGSLLAYNKGDRKYYVFNEAPLVDIFSINQPINEDISDTSLLYEMYSYDRSLYRLRGEIIFQFKVKKFGVIKISTEMGKEWNNTSEEYPISLNDWYVSILFRWYKNFKIFKYATGL